MDSSTCLELAIEGERLCKAGDFRSGVGFFEAAIRVGTSDTKILSAIYSQLGNGYFYLADYEKALDYHRLDLSLAQHRFHHYNHHHHQQPHHAVEPSSSHSSSSSASTSDLISEAKAFGNLGNTLKMLGRYHEAIAHCERHLALARQVGDAVGEGRALYNLANVYHTEGKHAARIGAQDPGQFPGHVRETLEKAAQYYEYVCLTFQ